MTRIVLTLILLFTSAVLTADVLLIEQVRHVEGMAVPENGQTQAEVEARFGAPRSKGSAVGDPPITRWDYADYSVYFEHDLVLFSVLHPGGVIEKS